MQQSPVCTRHGLTRVRSWYTYVQGDGGESPGGPVVLRLGRLGWSLRTTLLFRSGQKWCPGSQPRYPTPLLWCGRLWASRAVQEVGSTKDANAGSSMERVVGPYFLLAPRLFLTQQVPVGGRDRMEGEVGKMPVCTSGHHFAKSFRTNLETEAGSLCGHVAGLQDQTLFTFRLPS